MSRTNVYGHALRSPTSNSKYHCGEAHLCSGNGIRMDVVRGRPSLLSKRSRFRPSKHERETVVRGSRPLGAGSAPLTPFNPSLRVNSRSPWTVTHWTTVTHSRSSWSLLIILQSIFYGIRSVRERTINIPSCVTVFLRADVEILRIP